MNFQKPLPITLVILLIISLTAAFAAVLCQFGMIDSKIIFLNEVEDYQTTVFPYQAFVIFSVVLGVLTAIVYQAEVGNFRSIRWVVRLLAIAFAGLIYWSVNQIAFDLFTIVAAAVFCLFALICEVVYRSPFAPTTPLVAFASGAVLSCLGLFVVEKAMRDPDSLNANSNANVRNVNDAKQEHRSNGKSIIEIEPSAIVVRIGNQTQKSSGSGVIVGLKNSQAYILTAAHLVGNGDRIVVEQFDRTTQEIAHKFSAAKVVASDHLNDLALIRVLALSPVGLKSVRISSVPYSSKESKTYSVATFGCTAGQFPTKLHGDAKRSLVRISENADWRLVWEFAATPKSSKSQLGEKTIVTDDDLEAESKNSDGSSEEANSESDINTVPKPSESQSELESESVESQIDDNNESLVSHEGRSGGPMLNSSGELIGIASGVSGGKSYFAHLNEIINFVQSKKLEKYFD